MHPEGAVVVGHWFTGAATRQVGGYRGREVCATLGAYPEGSEIAHFLFTVCMSRRGVCVWIAAKGWGGSGHICSPVVHQHAVLVRAGAL
jgi:hypothetical protein